MKGHNYGKICGKCGKEHRHPRGSLGKKFSDAVKQQMSLSRKEFYKTHDVWNKGRKHPEETKRKMRGKIPHNKGKTKENYFPLKKVSKKLKKFFRLYPNLGEKNRNWKGGKSFEPYPPEFNIKLKKEILMRDNWICQLCYERIIVQTRKKFITIHHIDYNKENSNPKNLIVLCNLCNSSSNSSRKHWETLFNKKILEIYNG